MSPSLNYAVTARIVMALVVIMLNTAYGFAGSSDRKPVVVVHPRHAPYAPVSPYAPYYYSRWNPYSLYSIYDRLSGGRQLCHFAERTLRQRASRAKLRAARPDGGRTSLRTQIAGQHPGPASSASYRQETMGHVVKRRVQLRRLFARNGLRPLAELQQLLPLSHILMGRYPATVPQRLADDPYHPAVAGRMML